MRKRCFSEVQIIGMIKEQEAGNQQLRCAEAMVSVLRRFSS